jgi:iron complex outermembrane receptor protein
MKKTVQFLMLALLWTNAAFAQQALVGVVQDGSGAPVAGANVVVKGTNLFAVSESSGRFSLAVRQAPPFTLRISSVGFKAQEIQVAQLPAAPLEVKLVDDNVLNEVVVTARRRAETAQEVPIPISVVSGAAVEEAGAFNVNRIKELVPTVQLYSSNPRNTTLNIRGLGSTFGLTNDGIDPGVGFYVDGVYFARPAATSLDFIDIEQIEVLRGPQGTLFGKNTTAGAFNVTTAGPALRPAPTSR